MRNWPARVNEFNRECFAPNRVVPETLPTAVYFCQYVIVRESVSKSFLSISSGVHTQTWR
jgi:hypothetical protein